MGGLKKLDAVDGLAAAGVSALGLLGALPLLLGAFGGAAMDEQERLLLKARDEADREAQYLLRMVEHERRAVEAHERGVDVDVKQALPLSELQGAVRDAMWAVALESSRQLLLIYEEDYKKAEAKWKAATEALLHYRNEQELLRQNAELVRKARLDAILVRLSEKYPGRSFHSYDTEWIEEALAYDREFEAKKATESAPKDP